jgi:hypothetical protein
MICTAESVVFTPWPPLPEARQTVDFDLVRLDLTSTSSASGNTATVAVLVWMRPCASVAGTRWTRCTPLSCLRRFVNVLPVDLENDFPKAAEIGRTGIHRFHLPAHRFGIAGVHAVKIGGEQRGFRTARARADFHDGVARIGGIGRHDAELQLRPNFFSAASSRAISSLAISASSDSGGFAGEQGPVLREIGLGFQKPVARRDQVP